MNNPRTFQIDYSIYSEDNIAYAIITIDQSVIDAVDDNWRLHLYNLNTPEEIAEHIGFNMLENHLRLSQLDGWADMSDSMARVVEWPDFNFDMETRELK